ncbi:MAG: AraC family transcriptional regulator [Lachnospiraceae bacterium]|nr:AraC family transcriptional regulator [Lachnospiraceae bacterium]
MAMTPREGKNKDISKITISKGRRNIDCPLQPDHYHNYYEIFYLLSGKCRFLLKDTLYSIEKGDLIFIAPGELHHSLYYPGITCDIIALYFKDDFLLPSLFSQMQPKNALPGQSFMGTVPALYQEEFHSLISKMLSESTEIDEYSSSFLTCHLNELLLLLMRHSVMSEEAPDLINAKEADIMTAAKYIYRNFQKPLTLDEVASVASLSPTYFSKKFKLLTGMGFKEYLNYIRLKHASAALLTTDNSITDIALEYGFSDSNYFKDLFKKEFGKSPREYRKSRGN